MVYDCELSKCPRMHSLAIHFRFTLHKPLYKYSRKESIAYFYTISLYNNLVFILYLHQVFLVQTTR